MIEHAIEEYVNAYDPDHDEKPSFKYITPVKSGTIPLWAYEERWDEYSEYSYFTIKVVEGSKILCFYESVISNNFCIVNDYFDYLLHIKSKDFKDFFDNKYTEIDNPEDVDFNFLPRIIDVDWD